jgi:DNA replication protein DnaC
MYARENFFKVKSIIENRRTDAIFISEKRSEEVRALSSKIKEIDEELSKTGLFIFKTACAGGDIENIRKRNEELIKMREEELLRLGYPKDYTDVHYSCKECNDTGYIDTKMCACMRKMLTNENIRSSGMGALIEKQSFENFDLSWYQSSREIYEKMKSNIEKAKNFADEFKLPSYQNLIIFGDTGTGKTHVTTSIARRVIERGYEVLYNSAQNIVDAFENDKFRHGYGQPFEPLGTKYLECDLLIIDDLGTEFSTPFSLSVIYNILNTRQNKGLPTVISTNLKHFEFNEKYEDRIYSRILGRDSIVLKFDGRDYRINK